jgi:hypothetical protein
MKTTLMSCLFFVFILTEPITRAFAQSTDIRTVTIDVISNDCKLDYEDVNLSSHRQQYQAQWASTEKEFDILWASQPACKRGYFHVPSPGTPPPNPPTNVSDRCEVIPIIDKGKFPLAISWLDDQGVRKTCKDSGRVIVNDGQALKVVSHSSAATSGDASRTRAVHARTNLSKNRSVNIDEACMPSATPNLYIGDKTTLVWTAENASPGVKFTIEFQGLSPCWDAEDPPHQSVPKYYVTSGSGTPSDVCYVKTSTGSTIPQYKYKVSAATCPSSFLGYVNIRP